MEVLLEDNVIRLGRLTLGPFAANAYIVICRQTGDSVLVDAPASAGTIIESLQGTTPRHILLTHNHMDHTGALSELQSKLKVPLGAHAADSKNLPSMPERLLNDGDVVLFGKVKVEVLHTPGHTPGSLCFKIGKCLTRFLFYPMTLRYTRVMVMPPP